MALTNIFPTGLTQAQAVARVRTHINEGTLPAKNQALPDPDTITDLLNEGLEEVAVRLMAIKQFIAIPIVANVPDTAFPVDMLNVYQAAYSTSPTPFVTGAIVYPLQQVEVGRFYDLAGDQPTSGGGIPTYWSIVTDSAGTMTIAIWPPPFQNGFIFAYYNQRAMLWDSNNPSNTISLDSTWQRLAVLYASAKACESLESNAKADRFEAQYDKLLDIYLEAIQKRVRPRGGQVRDVRMSPVDPRPAWMR